MKLRWPRRRAPARWLVVDVESSGLDVRRDRLLAIAALAVRPAGERLVADAADSFEVVLRQPALPPDKANILVHGIGVGAQRAGVDAAQAFDAFERYAGASPLIAFHAAFDRALIDRALREAGRAPTASPWLDLAELAPVLAPHCAARSLDEWLAATKIAVFDRHRAAADVLATAALLQKLWPAARAQGAGDDFRALAGLAAARRWLGAG